MVSGHLQVKKGFYYVVLSYYNNNGKRRVKYFSTGLPEKGNKRKAEAELARIRSEFVPPQEVGELASDMPFADYLLEWLEIVKVRVKATTFSSYEQMVKSVIEPYFRKKAVTLQGLEARHIQQFYSEKLKTVKPNSVIHYHAVIHQALKYAMKTDLVAQNVAMKVDRPKKNDFQPVFLDAAAQKDALRHVLAGAGQMFFDLCSRLGDHVPMDVGKAVEGAPGVPCVIAFADLLVDPLLCFLFQKR